jgi:hypothetical protein
MAVSDYLGLIVSQHNQRPKYMAMINLTCKPMADGIFQLSRFPFLFDLDQAVGDQLDILGEWIGASRNLKAPLPPSGITVLGDADYRTLLKAVVATNYWDGTVPGMYAIWASVFQGNVFEVLIQDYQDMTMAVIILATDLGTVALALLINGYIELRPAGVGCGFYQATGSPVFGLDVESSTISGLDVGYMVEDLVV